MIFKFKYLDSNDIYFETNANDLNEAILKLRRLDGKLTNPSNLVLDVRKWLLNSSISFQNSDSLKLKDKGVTYGNK